MKIFEIFEIDIFEKCWSKKISTFAPKSCSNFFRFQNFYFGSKPVARFLYLLSGFPVVWRQLRTPDLNKGEA